MYTGEIGLERTLILARGGGRTLGPVVRALDCEYWSRNSLRCGGVDWQIVIQVLEPLLRDFYASGLFDS